MRNQDNQECGEDPISSKSLLALRGEGDKSPTKEKKMIRPSELSWDEVVRVGPGTLGGNYLRCFWWPVSLSEEVRTFPFPCKRSEKSLCFFVISRAGWRCWVDTVRFEERLWNTEEPRNKVSVAPTTVGVTTGEERSSIVQPNPSRPRQTSAIRGIPPGNWAALSS